MTTDRNGDTEPQPSPGAREPTDEGLLRPEETLPVDEPEAMDASAATEDTIRDTMSPEGPSPEEPELADVVLPASTSGRSWLTSMLGGILSTLMVFVFLGYLQPTMGISEAITLPDIVQLQTGLGSNRKPPPPPKQEQQKKPERKTQQTRPKQLVRNKVQRTKPTRAQQTMQRLAGGPMMDLGIGPLGGGGGASMQINVNLDAGYTEEAEALKEYYDTRERVRRESRRPTRDREMGGFDAGITEPRVLIEPDDIYPRKALEAAIEGFVLLNALISVDGSILEFEILGAQPQGVFEDAVIDSLHRWRFSPAQDGDGRPLEAWKQLNIKFQLEN